jgi:2',3'-cyclic-nucleotide 2'-phosphodiesterase/3'-nucleotidase/5'-nucleotidase
MTFVSTTAYHPGLGGRIFRPMQRAILLACLGFAAPLAAQDTARVLIVASTDVHGQATAWDYAADRAFAGGLTRAATVIDSLRRRYPEQVVVADAGDLLQGNPLTAWAAKVPRDPHPLVEALGLAGYDVATLGNHDFDFGVPFLQRALRGARVAFVSANVAVLPSDTLLLPGQVVLRRGRVRVAVTGITTTGVMRWDADQLKGVVRVRPAVETLAPVLRSMRRSADVVVVLSHAGLASAEQDTLSRSENVAADIAALPDAPDLVVLGHTHRELADTVIGRTHYTQPRPQAQSLSVTHVTCIVEPGGRCRVIRVASELVSLANVPAQPRMESRFAPVHEAAVKWLAEPIGTATAAFPGRLGRAEPVPLVNLLHEVQRARTGAELSVASIFRPEAELPAGPIRRADVAAVYPYENTLKAVRVSGAQLRAHLEHSARYYALDSAGQVRPVRSVPGYDFDMLGGAEYELDLAQPAGRRVRTLRVRGRDVAPTDTFTLALNSHRAGGAGGYRMLAGAPIVYDRQEDIRDLLVEEIARRGTLDPAQFSVRNWRLAPDSLAASARRYWMDPVAAVAPKPAAKPDVVALRVLSTNDLHGALEPVRDAADSSIVLGGLAVIDAIMDTAGARCRCPTLRLDAGDMLQGTLASTLDHGSTMLAAMKAMGVSVAAVGNHEFDWGQDTLRARLRESAFPWVSANVFDSATGRRLPWLASHRIVTVGGLRVAVVGYTTKHFKRVIKAEQTSGLVVRSGAATIRDVLDSVRTLKPDAVILLAHEGGSCDGRSCRGEIFELAEELGPGGVDLIVSGHSHTQLADAAGSIPIMQARSNGRAVGIADFVRKPDGGWKVAVQVVPTTPAGITPDAPLTALVEQAHKRAAQQIDRVVARLRAPMKRARGEHALGNFVADAQRNVTRADVAIMNNGGVRADLAAGSITFGELFAVMPFDNRVMVLELTGAQLREVFESALRAGAPAAHVSGVTVRYDPRRPAGERVKEVRFTDGRKLDDDRRYRLAVNDFMVTGGDGFAMFAGKPKLSSGAVLIDVLELYARRLPQPIEPPGTGRFQVDE